MTQLVRLAVLATVIAAFSTPVSAEEKLGYLDSAAVLRDMPEVQEAEKALVDMQVALRQERQSLLEAFQQDLKALQERADSGELSEEQRAEEAAKLNERRTRIQDFEGESARRIQARRSELFAPIFSKLGAAIAEVADEGGYTFIFNDQNILYYDEDRDISAKVRVKLNL